MEIDGNTKNKILPIYSQNFSWHKSHQRVMKDQMSRKHMKHWQSTRAQRQALEFFFLSLGFLNLSTNPAKNNDEVANRTLQYKTTLIQSGSGKQSWV
jgi:hypothetical protein